MVPETFGRAPGRIRVPPPGPRSRALAARLEVVESQDITYLADDFPVFWEEALGGNVRDADGNVYVDLTSAFGVALLGHAPPAVTGAVAAQNERLVHAMGDVHPTEVKVELLERLASFAPWRGARSVLATSGSEAVEVALKSAQLATGRAGIVAFEGSYHGLTLGSLAATSREHFRAPFRERLFQGVRFVPYPSTRPSEVWRDASVGADEIGPMVALQALRAALADRSGHPVGAVIVEAIQARAGVRIPPPGFLSQVAHLTREAGALLIADEIFTGMGRTGSRFGMDHEHITPDLICVGKVLGGGLPIAACLGPKRIMAAWPRSRGEAIHTSTFLGHPLAAAAAVAVLEELDREGWARRARDAGEHWLHALQEALAGSPLIADVRGRGLLIGIELGVRGMEALGGAAGATVRLLGEGVLVLPAGEGGNVIELSPPACLTAEQVAFSVDALRRVLAP